MYAHKMSSIMICKDDEVAIVTSSTHLVLEIEKKKIEWIERNWENWPNYPLKLDFLGKYRIVIELLLMFCDC